MKKILKLAIIVLLISSCSDVIDVKVQNDSARLVVEASLDWEKGTSGNEQTISLKTSSPFFDTTSNTAVTGAMVKVTNNTNGVEIFFVDQNNGDYTTNEFVPLIGQSYTLEIAHNGDTYTASETLNAVPDITEIYQDVEDGFDDELLEIHLIFTDPADEVNSYLFRYDFEGELLPELEVGFDEFVNGNEIDWWYELEEEDENDEIVGFQPGDVVDINMYGISVAYKDYVEILINQIGGVGLFDATPVSVKGNCVNTTNPDNFAHGYFRLTQFNKVSYTFE